MTDKDSPIIPLLWDKISGDSTLREVKREEEEAHERRLAEIRAESHALVWTGTAEELTGTIKRWFESGWIVAESLQDALQLASIHFRRPDGMPIVRPFAPSTEHDHSAIFSASPTYQKIVFRGNEYDLTAYHYASDIVRVLHESLRGGGLGLTVSQIRERAKLPHNGSMYDWFRGTGLWKNLIVTVGRNLYRLDISPQS
jgi:hypothetical protein